MPKEIKFNSELTGIVVSIKSWSAILCAANRSTTSVVEKPASTMRKRIVLTGSVGRGMV